MRIDFHTAECADRPCVIVETVDDDGDPIQTIAEFYEVEGDNGSYPLAKAEERALLFMKSLLVKGFKVG